MIQNTIKLSNVSTLKKSINIHNNLQKFVFKSDSKLFQTKSEMSSVSDIFERRGNQLL